MVDEREFIDAVFGWCYCRRLQEWSYRLLYWPVRIYLGITMQVFAVKILGCWSGYMSRYREMHWVYPKKS